MIITIIFLWGFAMFILGAAVYEYGQRKGVEEAEAIYEPILGLALKWAELHIAMERKENHD